MFKRASKTTIPSGWSLAKLGKPNSDEESQRKGTSRLSLQSQGQEAA